MAGGIDLGSAGKGRRKPLDTAINLVPFIDLMAVTISFLIMTAVWNQIAKLPVSAVGGSGAESTAAESPTVSLRLLVASSGLTLYVNGAQEPIARRDSGFATCHGSGADRIDADCEPGSLVGELRKVKASYPGTRGIALECEDGVAYQQLVRVIDACNLKGADGEPTLFPDIALSGIQ